MKKFASVAASAGPSPDPAMDRPESCARSAGGDEPAPAQRRSAALDRLTEIGVAVAEELPALARAQSQLAEAVTDCLRRSRPDGVAALGELAVLLHKGNVDFALMYERICRAVRRCIGLLEQLATAQPLRARAAPGERQGASGDRRQASEPRHDRDSSIEQVIAAERRPETESLLGDLFDRPEDPTGMDDLGLDRPLSAIIAEICADFGVDGREWAAKMGLTDDLASECDGHDGRESGAKAPATAPPGDRPARSPKGQRVGDDPARPFSPARFSPAAHPSGLNRHQRRAAKRRGRNPPKTGNDRPVGSCGPPREAGPDGPRPEA